ncbi:MAG: FAD-dependent oxidoreductase [Halioglobus sp.]
MSGEYDSAGMPTSKRLGLSRRQVLSGLGGAAAFSFAGGSAAVPRSSVKSWDMATDILVAGSGAAGVSAAIEAKLAGAEVLMLEALRQLGGSSIMSGGVVYAGGGTSLQRALGVADSVENMYAFMVASAGLHPQLEKIQSYCEGSAANFDWLVDQGVPYTQKLSTAKGLPEGDESLYFSGNEDSWQGRRMATAVPRGHAPGVSGKTGGRRMMEALLASTAKIGVLTRTGVASQQLIVESDGKVAGMMVSADGQKLAVRVRRAVILASGGFVHNREMLKHYAPQLYDCAVPWAGAHDLGQGISMGVSAGAAAHRMQEGYAATTIRSPTQTLSGIVVNTTAQRFIAEDASPGVLGNAIAYCQQGAGWLITDDRSSLSLKQDDFPLAAEGQSIGDLAHQLGFPPGALQNTVAYYNRFAGAGEDPLFRKSTQFLRPLQGPPYRAWNLSVTQTFTPTYTLGGLHTTVNGQVLNGFGETIPGLYAVGRTAAGLPSAPYFAEGLSLGDCIYFGRRGGQHAVLQKVSL